MAITICSYNIEWFDELFTGTNKMKQRADEVQRFEAIRDVLATIDADLIGLTEAPNTTTTTGQKSTVACLQAFAAWAGLRTKKALIGFPSAGRQELAFLFDPDKLSLTHVPGGKSGSKTNPPLNEQFFIDTDEDDIKEVYKLYRPPLEARIKVKGTTKTYHAMVVHTKSKGIFNAVDMLHWQRENTKNRRKLYGECTRIRQRIDEWLDKGHHVIVMGDINDGPGMDAFEFQFARSAVEILMGDLFDPDRVLRNYSGRPKWGRFGWEPSSARFKDRMTEDWINVLIDHILVSSGVRSSGQSPHKIWNPFRLAEAKPLKQELLAASDHFPVTLRIA